MDFHYKGHRIKSTKTKNKKLAIQRAIQVEAALIEGTYENGDTSLTKPMKSVVVTIASSISDYISYHKTQGTRKKTYIRYEGILSIFDEFVREKGVSNLDGVTLILFDQFQAHRAEKISKQTMFNEGTTVKRFLKWCVEREMIRKNPLDAKSFKRPKSKATNVLTLEQVNRILAASPKGRQAIFATLAFGGMRVSELKNLRFEDVDLTTNWIYIVSRTGFENKTGKDWKVPIHPRLKGILQNNIPPKKEWFFCSKPSSKYPNGNHFVSAKRLNEDFRRVLARLKIPEGKKKGGFTLHSLRHFFKTFCIMNGRIPKEVVDLWQGHELDSRQASNQYIHLSDSDSQRLMSEVPFGT